MQVKELAKKLQEAHITYIKDNIPELYWEYMARVALEYVEERGIDQDAEKIWALGFRINPVQRTDRSVLVDIECTVESEHGVMRCDNYLIVRAIMPTLTEAIAATVYYIENGQAYVEFLPDGTLKDKDNGNIYKPTTLGEQYRKYINKEEPK